MYFLNWYIALLGTINSLCDLYPTIKDTYGTGGILERIGGIGPMPDLEPLGENLLLQCPKLTKTV